MMNLFLDLEELGWLLGVGAGCLHRLIRDREINRHFKIYGSRERSKSKSRNGSRNESESWDWLWCWCWSWSRSRSGSGSGSW